MCKGAIITLLLVLIIAITSPADVPQRTSYQGNLTDSGGSPLTGNFDLTFKIYDDSVGGSLLYEETHVGVSVVDGLFSVLIGGKSFVAPYDDYLFDGPDRFLGITVGADPELAPRTRLSTAPYSFRVGSIDGATGGTVSGDFQVNGQVKSSSGGFEFPDNSVQMTAATNAPTARTEWFSPFWQNASSYELYTQLAVYNTASVSCSVTVSFYSNDGTLAAECGANLGANSVWQVGSSTALTNPCATNDGYGHIEITASEPVAPWGVIYKFSNGFIDFNMGVPISFYAPQ